MTKVKHQVNDSSVGHVYLFKLPFIVTCWVKTTVCHIESMYEGTNSINAHMNLNRLARDEGRF